MKPLESGDSKPEFLLMILALVGMMLMISANDLIMKLYMAVELQSLPLYVVAACERTRFALRSWPKIFSAWGAVFRLVVIWGVIGLWICFNNKLCSVRLRFSSQIYQPDLLSAWCL